MKAKNKKIFSIIFSLLIFISINIPSLKIFKSSELINPLVLFLIWILGFIRITIENSGKITMNKNKQIFFSIFILMWLMMFLITLIKIPASITIEILVKYLSVIFITIGISIFAYQRDVKNVIYLQLMWAVFLSIFSIKGYIKLNSSLGQHYLTIGMPIAAGIVCGIGILMYQSTKKIYKLLVILALLICLIAVISLKGRSPVILSVLTPLITTIFVIFFDSSIKSKIKTLSTSLLIILSMILVFSSNVSNVWLDRFLRIENFKEESRYYVYSKSIDILINNPFGVGLNGTEEFGIVYPHNIFLEITLSGGIISLVLFFLLLVLMIRFGIKSAKIKSDQIIIFSLFSFFFFTWNISFNLSSSYVLFTVMALIMVADN